MNDIGMKIRKLHLGYKIKTYILFHNSLKLIIVLFVHPFHVFKSMLQFPIKIVYFLLFSASNEKNKQKTKT